MARLVKCDDCQAIIASGEAYFEVDIMDGSLVQSEQYHADIPECAKAAAVQPVTISGSVITRRNVIP